MAKSKSQERREAAMKSAEGTTPGWKENQQKETNAVEQETRQNVSNAKTVKVKMKTDYRDVAKAGEVYETDSEKAAELVRLGRAEYLSKSGKSKEETEEVSSDDNASEKSE